MSNPSLPPLTAHGLLPEGVHYGTLEEVAALFGRFQRRDHRVKLFAKLRAYVDEVRRAGWGASVLVDGSFVMAGVDDPGDIDLILVLPADWDFSAELRPSDYNLVAKQRVRKRYGFDVIAVRSGSNHYNEWVEYFQQIRPERQAQLGLPKGVRKGLVRIEP